MSQIIRLATADDAPFIQAIYAPIVRETTISFETEPPDAAEIAARIAKVQQMYPWLVLEQDGIFAGYAYATRQRDRAAYQWNVEVSVYVDPAQQGKGVGWALYETLFNILRRQGFYNAYAIITLPNPASVAIHEKVGFRFLTQLPETGYKFGAWHATGWWALELQPKPANPPPPIPLRQLGGEVFSP
jgi:L-amino acid N-acyltransferase YncA